MSCWLRHALLQEPSYAAPKEDVAQAVGVGKATLVRAEQHVEAGTTYPELIARDIPQRDAIAMAKVLDALPSAAADKKPRGEKPPPPPPARPPSRPVRG